MSFAPDNLHKGEVFTQTFELRDGSVTVEMAFRVLEVQRDGIDAQIIGVKRTDNVTGEVTEIGEDDIGSGA